ncbi:hypothetical protein ACIL2M_003178 [Vibrio vulnificus]
MNISTLEDLSNWVVSVVARCSFVRTLENMTQILNNLKATNAVPNQVNAHFDNMLVEIKSKLEFIENDRVLSDEDVAALRALNLDGILLPESYNSYRLILSKVGKLDSSFELLKQKTTILKNTLETCSAMNDTLSLFSLDDSSISRSSRPALEFKEGKVFTRLRFHKDASINSIVDLQKWSDSLFTIGRGFSMLHGYAPEEVEIVGAGRGSILIDMLANIETANAIGEAINHLLDAISTGIEIAGAIEALRRVKKSTDTDSFDDTIKKLEEEHDSHKEQQYDEIVNSLIKSTDGNLNASPELRKAIKDLDKFLQKGGDIKFIESPDSTAEEKEVLQKLQNVESRILEHRRDPKLLQDKTKKDTTEE